MKTVATLALIFGLAFATSAMAAHTCGQLGGSCLPHNFNPGGPGLPGPFPTPTVPKPQPLTPAIPIPIPDSQNSIPSGSSSSSSGITMPTYPPR